MSRKKGNFIDPRSTGRKQARRVMLSLVEQGEVEFSCSCEEDHDWHEGRCGWEPDPSLPVGRSNNLDVNHKNKNWLDNDPVNLEFLCRRCHREIDRRTEKGVSDQKHYDDLYGGSML